MYGRCYPMGWNLLQKHKNNELMLIHFIHFPDNYAVSIMRFLIWATRLDTLAPFEYQWKHYGCYLSL